MVRDAQGSTGLINSYNSILSPEINNQYNNIVTYCPVHKRMYLSNSTYHYLGILRYEPDLRIYRNFYQLANGTSSSFPSVKIGTTSDQVLDLRNGGSLDLEGLAASLEGTDAVDSTAGSLRKRAEAPGSLGPRGCHVARHTRRGRRAATVKRPRLLVGRPDLERPLVVRPEPQRLDPRRAGLG